jgi:glucose-6-phosphate isomerase
MSTLTFSYQNSCLIDSAIIEKHISTLESTLEIMHNALSHAYETPYASLSLPFDTAMYKHIETLLHHVHLQRPELLIIIGIGGSNLGTYAIQQALQGLFYNELNRPCRVYYADTVDTSLIQTLSGFANDVLQRGGTILLNVVSKSGTTLETMVNFGIFCDVLRIYHPNDWYQYVVVTTDHNSALWYYAQENNVTTLEIPALVGGRFSVLSPVGLFPLGLLGLDIHQLCAGARDVIINELIKKPRESMAAISAAILYEHYMHGMHIHDTFIFSPQLEAWGKWYRQLCAESLGKINRLNVSVGITPTVSIGSTDLHSVGQLYLGGPRDRVTTFIQVHQTQSVSESSDPALKHLVPHVREKSLEEIMHAIAQGTCQAYQEAQRPYMKILLPDLSPYTIGALMQYKMLEIMYLGHLLMVNPFDQPHVEEYKVKTRVLL